MAGARILLFTGKGGVGKTTLAAATAARLAVGGRKVLVASADPAHSLGDVFGRPARRTNRPKWTPACTRPTWTRAGSSTGRGRTSAASCAPWLAGAGLDELDAEELTVLPGVDELLALTEVARLARHGPWEVVVVDCGPTAETLRLLALPEAVAATWTGCSCRPCTPARPRSAGSPSTSDALRALLDRPDA